MHQTDIGNLIRKLRLEKGMTQLQLAQKMNISDKTVSKWERGFGCPDVSLLPELSLILNIDLDALLSGASIENNPIGGNMKKLVFYVCPECGNLITAAEPAQISCCSRRLAPLEPQKPQQHEALTLEMIDDAYYVTSTHEMTKDHHISFVALLTGDTLILKKQYAEWGLETHLPYVRHGMLLWYCTRHGLFYQMLS